MAGSISSYEQQRREKMEKNAAMLEKLGIAQLSTTIGPSMSSASSSLGKKPLKLRKRKPDQPTAPTRRSKRLSGLPTDLHDLNSTGVKEEVAQIDTRYARNRERNEDRQIKAECLNESETSVTGLLRKITREEEEAEEKSPDLPLHSRNDWQLNHEEHVAKVVPQRIFCAAFLPVRNQLLAATGDREGHLGFWTPPHVVASDDSNHSVETQEHVSVYRPFVRPVSDILFSVHEPNVVIAASYDGTVRRFDLNEGQHFESLYSTADPDVGIQSICMHRQSSGEVCWASFSDGTATRIDARVSPNEKQQTSAHGPLVLHEKKINTIQYHPTNSNVLVTASLDRTVRIWDVRKLKKKGTNNQSSFITEYVHPLSVNSASFSPSSSGQVLATVCQNNSIYLFHAEHDSGSAGAKDKAALVIPHDNQTGRWISKFKAVWDPKSTTEKDARFVIGSKHSPRCVEIFSATSKRPMYRLMNDDWFQSIHSINCFHPYHDYILSGNSSGRMALWTPTIMSSK